MFRPQAHKAASRLRLRKAASFTYPRVPRGNYSALIYLLTVKKGYAFKIPWYALNPKSSYALHNNNSLD